MSVFYNLVVFHASIFDLKTSTNFIDHEKLIAAGYSTANFFDAFKRAKS